MTALQPLHPSTRMPEFADIQLAAQRIAGTAYRTPLLESPGLNAMAGCRVLVKAECLQRTGSFKFRGAYNKLALIPPSHRAAGVIAFSSGNHAQGVAHAARLLGMPATVIMPADSPRIKQEATRGEGAEVILYNRATDDREAIARALQQQKPAALVPPFDDTDIIAGQGTIGLEIAQQADDLGIKLDAVIACCSGGGMAAGIGIAIEELSPATRVYSAEPRAFNDTERSLASGQRERNPATTGSICDALLSPMPGSVTFPINQRVLAGGLSATDDDVRAAMRAAFRHLRIVLEPGGAVALATVLNGRLKAAGVEGGTVAVVASGGNVDPSAYAEILRAA